MNAIKKIEHIEGAVMFINKKYFFPIILLLLPLLLSACSEEEDYKQTSVVIDDVYVEMSDGVKLATRIYRPQDDNRYPVLLARSPYNSGAFTSKEEGDYREVALKMAEKGYVVVIQDMRGLYGSEGEWRLFKDDAKDGHETVLWLNEQPWSNGEVGAFGTSALGMAANLLATTNPPGLKAAFVQMAPSQFYEEVVAEGGIYRHELATRWMYFINAAYSKKLLLQGEIDGQTHSSIWEKSEEFPELYLHAPLNSFPHLSDNPIFTSVLEHYKKDDYFEYYDIAANFSNINIPIYHVGGWYDTFLDGTIKNFVGLQENGGTSAKGNQKLLLGPWTHHDFPQHSYAVAEHNVVTEMTRWFDYWLKDIDNGVMDEDPIKYFTIGTEEWKTAKTWPNPEIQEEKWFFNNEESNSAKSLNDGGLSKKESAEEAKHQYEYDPLNPIITIGGRNLFEDLGMGPLDQRPAEEHSLTYTSEPLKEELEIEGTVTATLYVSSNVKDTDFTMKLTDVAADGSSFLINEGGIRMRFREGLDKEVFMEPGKIYQVEVDLHEISHVFLPGHRIRVSVASSNFPRYDRNTNTGNPLGEDAEEDFVIAENAVHFGPNKQSHITLPVIKTP